MKICLTFVEFLHTDRHDDANRRNFLGFSLRTLPCCKTAAYSLILSLLCTKHIIAVADGNRPFPWLTHLSFRRLQALTNISPLPINWLHTHTNLLCIMDPEGTLGCWGGVKGKICGKFNRGTQSEREKQTQKPFFNTPMPFVYPYIGTRADPTLSVLKMLLP